MNRISKWLCFVLILCMLGSMLPFALADGTEAAPAVEDTVLPAGQYRLRYSIMDMLDRTYHTEFFYLTWDGENAVFDDPAAEE